MKYIFSLFCILVTILIAGNSIAQEIPESSVSSFNEKGFPDNKNSYLNGREIINDYNGNLMLSYNQRAEYFEGDMTDFSLYYNTNVAHRIFYGTNFCVNGFSCNSPEWIVGYAGIALQTFNFETNFTSNNGNGTPSNDTLKNSEIGLLIPGYHFSNKLNYDALVEDNGHIMSGYDFFNILTADGSTITLYNSIWNQHIGKYFEEGIDGKGIAIVDFLPNSNNLLRKMYYKPGDGKTYYFEEEWAELYGADTGMLGAKALYLKEIYSPMGDTIKFHYSDELDYNYVLPYGRKVFKYAELNKQFENNSVHKPISIDYQVYPFDNMIRIYKATLHSNAGYPFTISFDLSNQADLSDCSRESGRKRSINVVSIVDDNQRQDNLTYQIQERTFDNGSNVITKIVSALINSIDYFSGKKTEFSFYNQTYTNQITSPIELCFPNQFNIPNMNAAFRDCYTNYMIRNVNHYEDNQAISSENFVYSFDHSANNNLDLLPLMRNEGVIVKISTIKTTTNNSTDSSIPDNIVNVKEYNQYKTAWYSIINSDFSSTIKLMEDKIYSLSNPSNNLLMKKVYQYETGNMITINGFYEYYAGDFHQKSVIEGQNDGIQYKERLLESTTYLDTEYIPTGLSNSKIVPKKIQTFDANGLETIYFLKNYVPTNSFIESDFYKTGLEEEIIIQKNQEIKSDNKNIFYGSENTLENPDGVMIGKLKQSITNVNSPSRFTFKTFTYFTPAQTYRYRGFLKSTDYNNGVVINYSYPDKDPYGDESQPIAFDSVYAYKVNFDLTKSYEYFSKGGQQFKPFKTVTKYNNLYDSLVIYTAYDTQDNLLFEVDANRNYSEYKYDNIGRIKSATFPGSFSDFDTVITNVYQTTLIDTLNFGSLIGSYRTLYENGESDGKMEIIKGPDPNNQNINEIDQVIKSDSEVGGETDSGVDTTHSPVSRKCYIFFDDPIDVSQIDSLLSVELQLKAISEYIPDPSESRVIKVRGIRSDSTLYGNEVWFTFSLGHIYNSSEINIQAIIEQFKNNGYDLIGLQFDSPYLTGTYEYNYKWFYFDPTSSVPLFISIKYTTTIIDTLHPEGSLFVYHDDSNRKVSSIRRFSNAPDGLTHTLTANQYFDVEGNILKNDQKNENGEFIQKSLNEFNYLQAAKLNRDGENRQICTKYDYLTRPIQQKVDENWNNGSSKHISYNLSSNTTYFDIQQITDEENKTIKKYFDKVGNLIKEEKIFGSTSLITQYNYDNLGRLSTVTTPENKTTTYLYDDHNNINQKTSPDEGTIKYKYDKYNNLRFTINTGNATALVFNKYDSFNRLILTGEKTFTNSWNDLNPDLDYSTNQGSIIAFENILLNTSNFVVVNMYDSYVRTGIFANLTNFTAGILKNIKGRLVATAFRDKNTGAWSYKVYSYDHLGRVKDLYVYFQTTYAYKKISTDYDNLGNVIKQNVNDQFYYWNSYDEQGRLKEVRSNMNNAYTTAKLEAIYTYDKSDKVTKTDFKSTTRQLYENFAYDTKGRLDLLTGYRSSGTPEQMFSEDLSYFNNDNVSSITILNKGNTTWPNLTFNFTYDDLNRLLSSDCNTNIYDETYTYSNDGNLLTKHRPSNSNYSQTYSYNTSGKNYLTGLTKAGTNYSFTYDNKGNMLTDSRKSITGMTYDRRNLPLRMTKTASLYYDYYYDDAGQRLLKQTSSTNKEFYLRDHTGKELAVYDWVTGKLKMVNIYGSGLLGKVNVSFDASGKRTDSRQYYIKDHLGSIRQVFDETATIVSAQDYYSYGDVLRSYVTGSNINDKYKFTEKERDTETNYDYFGARYYDSDLGRWLQVDPLADKYPGWSPYNYVENNPLRSIDPNGAGPWDIVIGTIDAISKNVYGVDKSSLTQYDSKSDYQLGQDIGNVLSAAFGTAEIIKGGVGLGADAFFELGSGGTLTPAVTIDAFSNAALVGHGAFVLTNSMNSMSNGENNAKQNNKLKPDQNAQGDHSTYKTDKNGRITNTATYEKNPKNPSGFQEKKRVDVKGKSHNGVETPHVHENGKTRTATKEDLPNQQ